MPYYTVPAVGSGESTLDPIRPDIPNGVAWVGVCVNGEYLIKTNVELPDKPGRTKQLPEQALRNACNAKGIPFRDAFEVWQVHE